MSNKERIKEIVITSTWTGLAQNVAKSIYKYMETFYKVDMQFRGDSLTLSVRQKDRAEWRWEDPFIYSMQHVKGRFFGALQREGMGWPNLKRVVISRKTQSSEQETVHYGVNLLF